MGLFSKIFGGNKQTSTTQSGWSQLPKAIQDAYTSYAPIAGKMLNPASGGASYFTPMATTADETRAYDAIRQGFAPKTAADITSGVSMFMNPYNDSVINDINNQATGDYSQVKSAVSDAGQFGSNRMIQGAGEVEKARLSTIGQLLNGQYDNALGYTMNQLPALKQQDTTNLLGIGEQQRALDLQNKQAAVSALNAWAKALGILPTDGGGTSTSKGTQDSGLFGKVIGSFFG